MVWDKEALVLLGRVPFFVRNRVKKVVERRARQEGVRIITSDFMKRCQKKYISGMSNEITGYQVESCFGPNGCPNSVLDSRQLLSAVENYLQDCNIFDFLVKNLGDAVKFHHEFRVVFADCPNACSRPQIVDFGVIACSRPALDRNKCSGCGLCAEKCLEGAIVVDQTGEPCLDWQACLGCSQCLSVCPGNALGPGQQGYRVLLGGKLGRHPCLGQELPILLDEEQVLFVLQSCVERFLAQQGAVRRLGDILDNGFVAGVLQELST